MIYDLTTQGVSEPYRMFTSRAEYRLRLRTDNADERLSGSAAAAGLLSGAEQAARQARLSALAEGRALLQRLTASPSALAKLGIACRQDGVTRSAFEWLRFPMVGETEALRIWPDLQALDPAIFASLVTDARYAVYVARQEDEIAIFQRDQALRLPPSLDFSAVPGLSHEMAERLHAARPETLGAASRIPGISPAALIALLPYAKRAA